LKAVLVPTDTQAEIEVLCSVLRLYPVIPSEQVSDGDDSSLAEIKELGESASPASSILISGFVAEARETGEPQTEESADEVTADEIQLLVSALTGIDLAPLK
jgi:hypothetical protein